MSRPVLPYGHTHGDYTVVFIDGEERGGVRTTSLGWRAEADSIDAGQTFPTRRAARWIRRALIARASR